MQKKDYFIDGNNILNFLKNRYITLRLDTKNSNDSNNLDESQDLMLGDMLGNTDLREFLSKTSYSIT